MNGSKKVIGIGEILWDLLPEGKQLGGAPTNFAYHAHQLGLDSSVISGVGKDELGQEIIQNIKEAGIISFRMYSFLSPVIYFMGGGIGAFWD